MGLKPWELRPSPYYFEVDGKKHRLLPWTTGLQIYAYRIFSTEENTNGIEVLHELLTRHDLEACIRVIWSMIEGNPWVAEVIDLEVSAEKISERKESFIDYASFRESVLNNPNQAGNQLWLALGNRMAIAQPKSIKKKIKQPIIIALAMIAGAGIFALVNYTLP
jgi:hypothetical protein